MSPEVRCAPSAKALICFHFWLPILVGGDLRATVGDASAGRWLREVFASRTLPSKFFSAQGGTPAPHAGAILLCQKAKDLTGTRPGHFHDKGILNQVVKRPKGEE
ncbi:hypothetical protein GCM10020255_014420 [Rhodococcus baikonurensis]